MEPDRFDYSPIIDRPVIRWPNDARVALWVAPNIEHYDYLPPHNPHQNAWPRTPHPDVMSYAYMDYGNRVGFWRLLELFDKHNIRCTPALNVAVLDHYPEIRDAMVERDWDFMSHGVYNTRYLWGATEEEERAFYQDTIDTIRRHTGKTAQGHARSRPHQHRAHPGPHGRSRPHLPHRLVPRRPALPHEGEAGQADHRALLH